MSNRAARGGGIAAQRADEAGGRWLKAAEGGEEQERTMALQYIQAAANNKLLSG